MNKVLLDKLLNNLVDLEVDKSSLLMKSLADGALATLGQAMHKDSRHVLHIKRHGLGRGIFVGLGEELCSVLLGARVVYAFAVEHCELFGFDWVSEIHRAVGAKLALSETLRLLVKLHFRWL